MTGFPVSDLRQRDWGGVFVAAVLTTGLMMCAGIPALNWHTWIGVALIVPFALLAVGMLIVLLIVAWIIAIEELRG